MKRGLAFIGILTAAFVAGCGSNPWDIQTSNMIKLEGSASDKISGLQQNISKAIEAYKNKLQEGTAEEKAKAVIDLDQALKDCKGIKEVCDLMQKASLDIQALGTISKERRQSLVDHNKKKIQDSFAECDGRLKKLDETVTQLMDLTKDESHPKSNDNIKKFKKEYDKTLSEFDGLIRQR